MARIESIAARSYRIPTEAPESDGTLRWDVTTLIVVHGHCYHKTVLGWEAEQALLRQMHGEVKILDDGCCGMAGAFGYEHEKYAYSKAIAEQEFVPAAQRAKEDDAVFVANGFSCRQQASHFTGLTPLTLPELLQQCRTGT